MPRFPAPASYCLLAVLSSVGPTCFSVPPFPSSIMMTPSLALSCRILTASPLFMIGALGGAQGSTLL